MAAALHHAYLLHRIPYRETSYLVDIFTREQGKIRGVAKGVRGSKSDRKSLLQAFQLLEIKVSGRNDLKNIGRVEALQKSFQFPNRNLFCAMYINELVNRVLPESLAVEDLFTHYETLLQQLSLSNADLASSAQSLESLLREFEINLLSSLGYMPDLMHCYETGDRVVSEGRYEYVQEQGVRPLSFAASQPGFQGADLAAIDAYEWTPSSLRAAKYLMRAALKPLLGDKPLKSRELFSEIR